jgi:hypothetical protein
MGGQCNPAAGHDACFIPTPGTFMPMAGHCAYGGDHPMCCLGCIDQDGVCHQGTSDIMACGQGGKACNVCPDHPQLDALSCLQTECLKAECAWTAAPVGTTCKAPTLQEYTCNGNGVCEDTDEACTTTMDCLVPPPCHQVRCNDTIGPRFHKCDIIPYTDNKDCKLSTCAVVSEGKSADICKAFDPKSIAYLCGYSNGPQLGIGACVQPNAKGKPLTWCCNLDP